MRCVNFGGAKSSVEGSIDRYGPFSRSLTARCSVILMDVRSAVHCKIYSTHEMLECFPSTS